MCRVNKYLCGGGRRIDKEAFCQEMATAAVDDGIFFVSVEEHVDDDGDSVRYIYI